ncbi:type VII toxin-antitoxin system MntA family adenylyltransferase antitoxin [Planococcus lenghuensis]|uniref:DNA polymerase subunit beta n=1 Tax=Planococcus lenghuensis TaxID=2213202 RepID=A0A1Q2L4P4_9BACL|nr:nucleotidyltransferase domain-containing protein [Planococcus lenghuensis]AQQ55420.1 DNA polymerase subunit beta [Planococcus lenghuensis]
MDAKLEQVKHFLIDRLSPMLLIVFGSTANGTARQDSDLDIAFLSNQQFDEYQVFIIAQELAAILNQDVDLIDLARASTVFQMQIVSSGKLLFGEDERQRMEFEMKTYKMYAKLNEERQPILDKIDESKSIYGKQ